MEVIDDIVQLERILDEMLPNNNKKAIEPYADLLQDLRNFQLIHVQDLKFLLEKHKINILDSDKYQVEEILDNLGRLQLEWYGTSLNRIKKGVFFGHVGLTREALEFEFGENWFVYNRKK